MNPTYKYELWFTGGHRFRLSCEPGPVDFKREFINARNKGEILCVGDDCVIDPLEVMYYIYQGMGKW